MREASSQPIIVLYDGWCPLCRRTARVLRRLDWLDRLEPVDFRRLDLPAFNARHGLSLTPEALDKEMYVVRRGRPFAGFDGYRVLAAALPPGWLMLPWLYLPGMSALGRWMYGVIARNRPRLLHCDDHCAVPSANGADDRKMVRDLDALAGRTYDLVVVGGGIHGACVAWDAALRGLTVALLEQGDFGEATSANSQKIVHGGFRYLQHGDIRRMRHSIAERRILLRIAPHLVHPLPVVLPTLRHGLQRRSVMGAALALYDLVAWDRNRGLRDPRQRIPASRVLSREECLARIPGLRDAGVTGGAVWYDGRIEHPERLTLAFLRSAAAQGAAVANYVQVTGFLRDGRRVQGVHGLDRLTGRTLTVRGRLVINTAGPWVNRVLDLTPEHLRIPLAFSKTIGLILNRELTDGYAVSLPLPPSNGAPQAAGERRRLFFVPWRGGTLAGSSHRLAEQDGAVRPVTDEELDELLRDINAVYPAAGLRRGDVAAVLAGLLPLEPRGGHEDPAQLTGRYRIRDHGRLDGVPGLLSVVGVKYTTARRVAEETVTRALRILGRRGVPSRSAMEPLWGGADASDGAVPLAVQVTRAVHEEMAQTLSDVVLRRTTLGTFGHPGRAALEAAASLMAELLGWDAGKTRRELEAVENALAARGSKPPHELVSR